MHQSSLTYCLQPVILPFACNHAFLELMAGSTALEYYQVPAESLWWRFALSFSLSLSSRCLVFNRRFGSTMIKQLTRGRVTCWWIASMMTLWRYGDIRTLCILYRLFNSFILLNGFDLRQGGYDLASVCLSFCLSVRLFARVQLYVIITN